MCAHVEKQRVGRVRLCGMRGLLGRASMKCMSKVRARLFSAGKRINIIPIFNKLARLNLTF